MNHPAAAPPSLPRRFGWSEERRVRHAAAIRRWKPWLKSTGPRTAAGKSRSAKNALRHGDRTQAARAMRAALVLQNRFLSGLALYIRMKQKILQTNY